MNNPTPRQESKEGKKLPLLAFFGLILLCIAVDQGTKYWAVQVLKPVGDIPLWEGVLHLTYAQNTGMAFSMLSQHTWVLTLITGLFLTGAIVFLILRRQKLPLFIQVVAALIIGGGIGNLIDRMTLGYVIDFIYVKIINFAIFNGADSFVVVGCILLLAYVLFAKELKKETVEEKDKADEKHEEAN